MNAVIERFQSNLPLRSLQNYFSLKAFLIGMGVVVLIYVGLFVFVLMKSDETLQNLEGKLASQSVIIEREIQGHTEESSHNEHIALPEQTGDSLFPAPLDGLYEKKAGGGYLPISKGNLTPFKAYKRAFTASGKPLIAIVVGDYGLSDFASKTVLDELPPEVSLAISPYAEHANDWQKRARKSGHELWMTLPIENNKIPNYDPGPQAVLRRASSKYNNDRIEWVLTRTTGYAGIISYTDNSFSGASTVIQRMFKDLLTRGLGFVELNPDAPPYFETIALSTRTPYARNNAFIETSSLKDIEKTARQYGYAVAILKPYPNSVKSVKTWMKTLEQKGFTLAPVSAVAELNSQ